MIRYHQFFFIMRIIAEYYHLVHFVITINFLEKLKNQTISPILIKAFICFL